MHTISKLEKSTIAALIEAFMVRDYAISNDIELPKEFNEGFRWTLMNHFYLDGFSFIPRDTNLFITSYRFKVLDMDDYINKVFLANYDWNMRPTDVLNMIKGWCDNDSCPEDFEQCGYIRHLPYDYERVDFDHVAAIATLMANYRQATADMKAAHERAVDFLNNADEREAYLTQLFHNCNPGRAFELCEINTGVSYNSAGLSKDVDSF